MSKKRWLEFDFPVRCPLDERGQEILKGWAAGSMRGRCCPYYFCNAGKNGPPCEEKVAEECTERCENYYEQYVRKGKV